MPVLLCLQRLAKRARSRPCLHRALPCGPSLRPPTRPFSLLATCPVNSPGHIASGIQIGMEKQAVTAGAYIPPHKRKSASAGNAQPKDPKASEKIASQQGGATAEALNTPALRKVERCMECSRPIGSSNCFCKTARKRTRSESLDRRQRRSRSPSADRPHKRRRSRSPSKKEHRRSRSRDRDRDRHGSRNRDRDRSISGRIGDRGNERRGRDRR
jgi:hypothetical protein